jgi:hypothetical protein
LNRFLHGRQAMASYRGLLEPKFSCFTQHFRKAIPPVVDADFLLALALDPLYLDPRPITTGYNHLALLSQESCRSRLSGGGIVATYRSIQLNS